MDVFSEAVCLLWLMWQVAVMVEHQFSCHGGLTFRGEQVCIVQRVVMPVTGVESWTVLGDDGEVVAPAERYLAYLSALERSPNTVRAYAVSLRLWFEFLVCAGTGWADAGVEDVARFVAWLRAPAENVIVLETGAGRRSAATVNRHLAAVFGLYDHHARSGVGVAAELVAWRRVSRGSYKPFLHHVTKGKPIPTRPARLIVTRRVPRTLDAGQVAAILAACEHLRDRFLLAVLAEKGCGSARRSACGTLTSSAATGRSASCPARATPTGRGPSCGKPR